MVILYYVTLLLLPYESVDENFLNIKGKINIHVGFEFRHQRVFSCTPHIEQTQH